MRIICGPDAETNVPFDGTCNACPRATMDQWRHHRWQQCSDGAADNQQLFPTTTVSGVAFTWRDRWERSRQQTRVQHAR